MLAPFFVQGGQDKIATEEKEFALAPHGNTFYSMLRRLFPPSTGSGLTEN